MQHDQYLYHITLATGHTRRSWRHEIDPAALTATREIVAAAMRAEATVDALCESGASDAQIDAASAGVQLPVPGATLQIIDSTRPCMMCTISIHGAPLITMGVATHQRCGARLWRVLTQVPVPQGADLTRPQLPWCAVRLHESLALYPEAAGWLDDAERCVAWAWLSQR